MFRDENSKPNSDLHAGLHLQLRDFANEELIETYGNLVHPLFIPSKDLCAWLDLAEEHDAESKEWINKRKAQKPSRKKRRRDSSPEEQLSPTREKRFEEDERAAETRSEQDDLDYTV